MENEASSPLSPFKVTANEYTIYEGPSEGEAWHTFSDATRHYAVLNQTPTITLTYSDKLVIQHILTIGKRSSNVKRIPERNNYVEHV